MHGVSVSYGLYDYNVNAINYFISGIFDVSPVDEDGTTRYLGRYTPDTVHAVFWIFSVTCSTTNVVTIGSDYYVTLVDMIDLPRLRSKRYSFVVHPVPVNELRECRLFPKPRWWLTADGADIGLTPGLNGYVWTSKCAGIGHISKVGVVEYHSDDYRQINSQNDYSKQRDSSNIEVIIDG